MVDIEIVKLHIVEKLKVRTRELLSKVKLPKDILNSLLKKYEFYKNKYKSVYKDIGYKALALFKKVKYE